MQYIKKKVTNVSSDVTIPFVFCCILNKRAIWVRQQASSGDAKEKIGHRLCEHLLSLSVETEKLGEDFLCFGCDLIKFYRPNSLFQRVSLKQEKPWKGLFTKMDTT